MNIYIITDEPFPYGRAATNRIICYCKGFVVNNASTKVICIKPHEDNNSKKKKFKGIFDNIPYEYACGTCIKGNTFLKRRLLDFKSIINIFNILKDENKRISIDAIIVYFNSTLFILICFIISKLLSINLIYEKSELPLVLKKTTFCGKFYAKLCITLIYKVFNGILVETKTLKNYYKDKIRNDAKMMIVPMTVETERFNINKIQDFQNSKYIAYCGTLCLEKRDGIPILIKAFSKISNKYKNLKLYIVGYSGIKGDFDKLQKLVFELNISDKVIFTGKVKRNEIPKYLINANILALAKTSDYISTGGLSSKIAEYLSTGNPVVMTNVGDISDFLTDEENVFFSDPDSVEKFADRLDYVLSNPDLAKKVGENGKKIALKQFNYIIQSKNVINFIKEINK